MQGAEQVPESSAGGTAAAGSLGQRHGSPSLPNPQLSVALLAV